MFLVLSEFFFYTQKLFRCPKINRISKFIFFFQESKKLFISLYKSWAHSEPAILALVFYAGCYSHGLKLVQEISKHEMTVDFLMGIDRFIQIMESPIFSCKFIFFIQRFILRQSFSR